MKNWRYVPIILAVMLVIALALMMLAMSVPNENIMRNLLRSDLIQKEGASVSWTPLGSSLGDIECQILAFGLQADQRGFRNKLVSVIEAPTVCADLPPYNDPFKKILSGEPEPPYYYKRYWYGSVAIYRPLLNRFAYQGVCAILILGMQALFVVAVIGFMRRGGAAAALGLIAPFLFLFTERGVVSPNFALLYGLMLFAVLIVSVAYKGGRDNTLRFVNIFVTIGGMTIFLDTFSNPLVTFMVPATALMWLKGLEPEPSGPKDDLRFLFHIAAAWCVGYFGFWILKFGLVFLRDGAVGIKAIVGVAAHRLHGPIERYNLTLGFGMATYRNVFFRVGGNMAVLCAAVAMAIALHPAKAYLYSVFRKRLAMLAICPIPILWYEVFANTSYTHSAFMSWNSYLILLPVTVIVIGSYSDAKYSPR